MIQVQHTITGQLTPCGCGKQPKHFETRGKNVFHTECPPCGLVTAKYPTLQEAIAEWEQRRASVAV